MHHNIFNRVSSFPPPNSKMNSLPVQMAVTFLLILAIAFCSLVAVYCIPVGAMQENLDESTRILSSEGVYPKLVGGQHGFHSSSTLDNFTDALMISTAAHRSHYFPLKASMRAEHWTIPEGSPVDALVAVQNFSPEVSSSPYYRYWHGYLIFLKPLLLFLDYSQIRVLLQWLQIALVFSIVALLGAKKEYWCIPPFALFWLFLNPSALSVSLQFNTIFMLTCLALLLLIVFRKSIMARKNAIELFFFTVGCLTSFFDFLTYPLVTLGIPLVYLLAVYPPPHPKKRLYLALRLCVCWTLGYGLMWASKWVLASLITHENVIQNAISAVAFRTGSSLKDDSFSFSFKQVIDRNYNVCPGMLRLSAVLALAALAYGLFRNRPDLIQSIPIALVAVFPYVWYRVLQNHSYIHAWFTYRTFSITVFALSMLACKMLLPPLASLLRKGGTA